MKLMDLMKEKTRVPKVRLNENYQLTDAQIIELTDSIARDLSNRGYKYTSDMTQAIKQMLPLRIKKIATKINTESVNEAEQDTPEDVIRKAKLAKVRADMTQLGAKQKDLGQTKGNAGDPVSKRQISKRVADIGVKKADLGIKAAQLSNRLKKPGEE